MGKIVTVYINYIDKKSKNYTPKKNIKMALPRAPIKNMLNHPLYFSKILYNSKRFNAVSFNVSTPHLKL
jgi:hypothetical protein